MLEGEFNRKLKKALEARLPGCVVLKHCDVATGGIPDFTVTRGLKTLWVECKMEGNRLTGLQENTMDRLNEGAFLIVAERNGNFVDFKYRKNGTTLCSHMPFSNLVDTIATLVLE